MRNDRRHALATGALIALGALGTLGGCGRSDPERELREALARIGEAVEARDTGAVLAHVADDFTRESGGLDKPGLRRLLAGLFLGNATIKTVSTLRSVRVDGNRAVTEIDVLATGGEGLLPERGRLLRMRAAWRHHDGRWQVYNAEWDDAQ